MGPNPEQASIDKSAGILSNRTDGINIGAFMPVEELSAADQARVAIATRTPGVAAPTATPSPEAKSLTATPQVVRDRATLGDTTPKAPVYEDTGAANPTESGTSSTSQHTGRSHTSGSSPKGKERGHRRLAGAAVVGAIMLSATMVTLGSSGNTERAVASTATATQTAAETATNTATESATSTATLAPAVADKAAQAQKAKEAAEKKAAAQASATASATATKTATASATATRTATATKTATATRTATATATKTATATVTGTATPSPSPSASPDASPSATPNASVTPTPEEQKAAALKAAGDAYSKDNATLAQDLKTANDPDPSVDPKAKKAANDALPGDFKKVGDDLTALMTAATGQAPASTPDQSQTGGAVAPEATATASPTPTATPPATKTTAKEIVGNHHDVANVLDTLKVKSLKAAKKIGRLVLGSNYHIEENNTSHKMNALDKDLNVQEMLAGVVIAAGSDSKEGTKYATGITNFSTKYNLPINAKNGLTPAQEEAYVEHLLTSKKSTCKIDKNFDHWIENGNMKDGGDMDAQMEHYHGPALICEGPNGDTVIFKIYKDKDGKICLNVIRIVPAPQQPTVSRTATGRVVITTPAPTGGTRTTPSPTSGTTPAPDHHGASGGTHTTTPRIKSVVEVKPTPTPTAVSNKTPKPVTEQTVPGAAGSGGSPEEGSATDDSDKTGYGNGDTVATPTATPVTSADSPEVIVTVVPDVTPAPAGGPAKPKD